MIPVKVTNCSNLWSTKLEQEAQIKLGIMEKIPTFIIPVYFWQIIQPKNKPNDDQIKGPIHFQQTKILEYLSTTQ